MKTILFTIFAVVFPTKIPKKIKKVHSRCDEDRLDISFDRARFNGFMSAP